MSIKVKVIYISEEKEKITIGTMFWILIILAIVVLTVLFFFSDIVEAWLLATVEFIKNFSDPFVLSLIFFSIMVLQSLAVPIPSELCLIAGGIAYAAIYPTNIGLALAIAAIIGYVASIVGAMILFYLGRKGGRPLVIKLLGESNMNFVDNWFKKWGGWAVGLGRLLPVVFYDPISLVGGATDMEIKHYIYGTLAGTVPRVFFYCSLGIGIVAIATEAIFNVILIIIVGVALVLLLVYWFLFKRYAKKEEEKRKEVVIAS
ncbi:MAG: TVP38/TMEM64 family protein [Promethearchaeota archaeon]